MLALVIIIINITTTIVYIIIAAIGSNEGRYGYNDVVLELRHTDASVPRARPAGGASSSVNEKTGVEWDAAGGTTNNGKSVPLRPPPDSF